MSIIKLSSVMANSNSNTPLQIFLPYYFCPMNHSVSLFLFLNYMLAQKPSSGYWNKAGWKRQLSLELWQWHWGKAKVARQDWYHILSGDGGKHVLSGEFSVDEKRRICSAVTALLSPTTDPASSPGTRFTSALFGRLALWLISYMASWEEIFYYSSGFPSRCPYHRVADTLTDN